MSDLLPPVLSVKAPEGGMHPEEILRSAAAQIAPLTGGTLQGEVWAKHLQGVLATYDFDIILRPEGPGYGILRVDHALTSPYPAYVSAGCFGEVWPPPPLGPSDPSYKIAPAARSPQELLALINQVLASTEARAAMQSLLRQPPALLAGNGALKNGPNAGKPETATSRPTSG